MIKVASRSRVTLFFCVTSLVNSVVGAAQRLCARVSPLICNQHMRVQAEKLDVTFATPHVQPMENEVIGRDSAISMLKEQFERG
jgi:hypothetical protein